MQSTSPPTPCARRLIRHHPTIGADDGHAETAPNLRERVARFIVPEPGARNARNLFDHRLPVVYFSDTVTSGFTPSTTVKSLTYPLPQHGQHR